MDLLKTTGYWSEKRDLRSRGTMTIQKTCCDVAVSPIHIPARQPLLALDTNQPSIATQKSADNLPVSPPPKNIFNRLVQEKNRIDKENQTPSMRERLRIRQQRSKEAVHEPDSGVSELIDLTGSDDEPEPKPTISGVSATRSRSISPPPNPTV